MTINPNIYVVAGIIATAMAQIFLKIATIYKIPEAKWIIYIFLSLLSYFISFIFYYLSLKYYDISRIQPVMMVSILIIISFYGYFSGESFNTFRSTGVLMAIASIIMIAKS